MLYLIAPLRLKLLSAISESGFDPTAMPVIFIGGGAGLMKRHVTPEDGLCRTIIMDSVSANAIGYEQAAKQALGRNAP